MSARNDGDTGRPTGSLGEILLKRRRLLQSGAALGIAAGLSPALRPAVAQDSSATPAEADLYGDGVAKLSCQPHGHGRSGGVGGHGRAGAWRWCPLGIRDWTHHV